MMQRSRSNTGVNKTSRLNVSIRKKFDDKNVMVRSKSVADADKANPKEKKVEVKTVRHNSTASLNRYRSRSNSIYDNNVDTDMHKAAKEGNLKGIMTARKDDGE